MDTPGTDITFSQRDLILRGLFELTITYTEDDETRSQAKALPAQLGGDPNTMFYGATRPGARAMTAAWSGDQHGPVGGVLAVLFTADRRTFFEFEDHTIRVAVEWNTTRHCCRRCRGAIRLRNE